MAASFAVSDMTRNVIGNKREHFGTITVTGTPTADGDAIAASAFGLSTLEQLDLGLAVDSVSSPANAQGAFWNKTAGKIVFWGEKTAGTDGQPFQEAGGDLSKYKLRFRAIGR